MQTTKKIVFLAVIIWILAFAFGSFFGYQYGQNEGQKFFDDAVKQARDAQNEAEEAQNEALRIQGEARRILM